MWIHTDTLQAPFAKNIYAYNYKAASCYNADIDECDVGSPCNHIEGSMCVNTNGSYYCDCPANQVNCNSSCTSKNIAHSFWSIFFATHEFTKILHSPTQWIHALLVVTMLIVIVIRAFNVNALLVILEMVIPVKVRIGSICTCMVIRTCSHHVASARMNACMGIDIYAG